MFVCKVPGVLYLFVYLLLSPAKNNNKYFRFKIINWHFIYVMQPRDNGIGITFDQFWLISSMRNEYSVNCKFNKNSIITNNNVIITYWQACRWKSKKIVNFVYFVSLRKGVHQASGTRHQNRNINVLQQ